MKKIYFPFILVLCTLLFSCEKDKNIEPVDINAIKLSLTGSWAPSPRYGLLMDKLIFKGDTLETINFIDDTTKEVWKGRFTVLSSGKIIAHDVTSVKYNQVELPTWCGIAYYKLDFITSDSIWFVGCVKWDRISGNTNSLTESTFHNYYDFNKSGQNSYEHYKLEFSKSKLSKSRITTNSPEYPTEGWHTLSVDFLTVASDYYILNGDQVYGYRFNEGDLYVGTYSPFFMYKRQLF